VQITTEWVHFESASRPMPDIAPPLRSGLLARLPEEELDQLRPHLEKIKLVRNQILFTPRNPVEHVYFVEQGMISLLADAGAGKAGIEVGMVGREGMAGFAALLSAHPVAFHHTTVQTPGSALRMPVAPFQACLDSMPALRERCLSYLSTLIVQMSQTATCISRHRLKERCADRLLAGCDRIESHAVPLTHLMLARTLGVRRAGVTVAVGALQNVGLVRCGRGNIEVLDHAGLEQMACGCHHLTRGQFDQG